MTTTTIPTLIHSDNTLVSKYPNLILYLDLLEDDSISQVSKDMATVTINQVNEDINWSELYSLVKINQSQKGSDFIESTNLFPNLHSVSQYDNQADKVLPIIEDIINGGQNLEDMELYQGWTLLTYIRAYLEDIHGGCTAGSFTPKAQEFLSTITQ